MTKQKKFQKLILSIIALTSLTILSANALAQNLPQLTVRDYQGGIMSIQGPTQFNGRGSSKGLKYIYATIQNRANNAFLTPDGRYSAQPTQLPVDFSVFAPKTVWRTESYNLPAGDYIFRIRGEDINKVRSEIIEVPFTVSGNGARKATPATASNQAPAISIQFPKSGAVMQGTASFRGIAKDDQAIVNVVATIMDVASGQFLTSNGQFSNAGQLNLRTQQGPQVQWASANIPLPAGNYLFSVKSIDNNGIESRWSQVKFSVAGQARTTAAAPAASQQPAAVTGKAANGMNYCSSAGTDADGDGFGWENKTSCVVAGSRADTHPNCASSASDPDGDGYGWENERSCIVVTHCASAASDTDGDGFGWENNKSCIVLKAANNSRFPTCASPASDPDGDGYGWENNKTCLVAK